MTDYSGKPNDELLFEINKRGGLALFENQIEEKKYKQLEIQRINKDVYSLMAPEISVQFIRKMVTSEIFTEEELDKIIENRFVEYAAILKTKEVNSKTIITGISASIASALIGAAVLLCCMRYITPIFYFFIPIIYIINYTIIRLVTKQTRSNWFIFIITLLSTIASLILSFYFSSTVLPSA